MKIPITAHIAAGSFLLPASAGIYRWKGLDHARKVFTLFCCYSVLHLITEFVMGRMGINNQWLISLYWLVELVVILYLYGLGRDRRFVRAFQILCGIFCLYWAYETFVLVDGDQFDDHVATVGHLVLIVLSVYVLQQVFKKTETSIKDHGLFWIASGVMLYNAGTIIVFSMSNMALQMGMEYFNILWHINWGFTIVSNILFARNFWSKTF